MERVFKNSLPFLLYHLVILQELSYDHAALQGSHKIFCLIEILLTAAAFVIVEVCESYISSIRWSFPFTASDLSGINTDASALDTAFASEVASSAGLQLAADGNTAISRSLEQIPWNFSLSDLTADLYNLGGIVI
ncbi:hypothetical protein K1719_044845 [Acacia pycnantha]|nr:hypothetical protein K1719_044845 [Acacia pycnantha]